MTDVSSADLVRNTAAVGGLGAEIPLLLNHDNDTVTYSFQKDKR